MILQKLVWDNTGVFGSRDMFFRLSDADNGTAVRDDKCTENEENKFADALWITRGKQVSFDTYFNMFSVWKWKKYTVVDKLSVSLELRGEGRISLIGLDREDSAREYTICERDFNCPNFETVVICREKALGDLHDFCFLRVEASAETAIRGGSCNFIDETPVKGVRLACCICTYQREAFVRRNVNTLLCQIAENPQSQLKDRLEIYIADNGSTLQPDMFHCHPDVHVISNRNYGGSAGFARNMIEAVMYRRTAGFSHLILMDDDILIYPEVLERTFAYLSVLRKEYTACILGGAMLLLEKRNIQAEACGIYDLLTGENRHTYKEMLDLAKRENLVRNECSEDANFSGWWYSCIPTVVIDKKNLPLPMFLHRDDQEYGVRSGRQILQMNGICIWHPSPAGKHSDHIFYYDMRNMLIADMNHYPGQISGRALKKMLIKKSIQCCLGYRYGSALMSLRGCEDFCRGIEYFKSINPERLHGELLEEGSRRWFDIPAGLPAACIKRLTEEQKLGIATKLWRYFFPAAGICYAEAGCNYPSYLGHKEVIYLNDAQDKGYRLAPSRPMTFRVVRRLMQVCRLIDREYDRACREWEKGIDELKSLEFWESYLGMK